MKCVMVLLAGVLEEEKAAQMGMERKGRRRQAMPRRGKQDIGNEGKAGEARQGGRGKVDKAEERPMQNKARKRKHRRCVGNM